MILRDAGFFDAVRNVTRKPRCGKCNRAVESFSISEDVRDLGDGTTVVTVAARCHGKLESLQLSVPDEIRYRPQHGFALFCESLPKEMFRAPWRGWSGYTSKPERPQGRVI